MAGRQHNAIDVSIRAGGRRSDYVSQLVGFNDPQDRFAETDRSSVREEDDACLNHWSERLNNPAAVVNLAPLGSSVWTGDTRDDKWRAAQGTVSKMSKDRSFQSVWITPHVEDQPASVCEASKSLIHLIGGRSREVDVADPVRKFRDDAGPVLQNDVRLWQSACARCNDLRNTISLDPQADERAAVKPA